MLVASSTVAFGLKSIERVEQLALERVWTGRAFAGRRIVQCLGRGGKRTRARSGSRRLPTPFAGTARRCRQQSLRAGDGCDVYPVRGDGALTSPDIHQTTLERCREVERRLEPVGIELGGYRMEPGSGGSGILRCEQPLRRPGCTAGLSGVAPRKASSRCNSATCSRLQSRVLPGDQPTPRKLEGGLPVPHLWRAPRTRR